MPDTPRSFARNIAEGIGLVALVLSLLVVAYEVRQSNRIAQSTITYEIGRDINEFNTLAYSDPEFAKFLIELRDTEKSPNDEDWLRRHLLAIRFLNI